MKDLDYFLPEGFRAYISSFQGDDWDRNWAELVEEINRRFLETANLGSDDLRDLNLKRQALLGLILLLTTEEQNDGDA